MFTDRIELFRICGFPLRLDFSWFLIAALLVWSLATGYFPWAAPGLEGASYWWMGVLGTLGLFASIVLHELAHALVARRYDLPISGITLFVFGGVAEMDDEPATPAAEFWMAIAGPAASFLIAIVLAGASQALDGGATPAGVVIGYLATINLVLAAFNLLPAFPLDGGRILRSLLWWWKGDLPWATRIAAASGTVLAFVLIALGVANIFAGGFVSGLWQMLLGFFLYSAAAASRASTELRHYLRGVRVSRIMRREPVAVPAGATVQELVDSYFYRHHFKFFPVTTNERLVGCVRLADVNELPRNAWSRTRVEEIMRQCGPDTVVDPRTPVLEALTKLQQQGVSRLIVASGNRLEGVISAQDIMNFLAVRMELRDHRGESPVEVGSGRPSTSTAPPDHARTS